MHTVDAVIQRLIDYMADVDLAKLSISDLQGYTYILTQIKNTNKKDYAELLVETMNRNYGICGVAEGGNDNGRTD